MTDPLGTTFNDRFFAYDENQISFTDGSYAVDRDLDNVTDFSFSDPDFSFVQFRSNLVMRWEYIPGSEIFLVWSQDLSSGGNPNDGLFATLDKNLFGDLQPKNIFLLKATYRFVL